MALSDFDLLAVNEKGKPINGVHMSPLGVIVEIYKNWIYIKDPKAWRKESGWTKPTIMKIDNGSFFYLDVYGVVLRGPQGGAFVVVWHLDKRNRPHGMIGCGTRAYIEDRRHRYRFTGVTKKSLNWFRQELKKKRKLWWTHNAWSKRRHKFVDSYGFTMEYVHYIPDCFREIDFAQALRVNQGDQFFTDAAGGKLSAATPIGKQRPTIASNMIRGKVLAPLLKPKKTSKR